MALVEVLADDTLDPSSEPVQIALRHCDPAHDEVLVRAAKTAVVVEVGTGRSGASVMVAGGED